MEVRTIFQCIFLFSNNSSVRLYELIGIVPIQYVDFPQQSAADSFRVRSPSAKSFVEAQPQKLARPTPQRASHKMGPAARPFG